MEKVLQIQGNFDRCIERCISLSCGRITVKYKVVRSVCR